MNFMRNQESMADTMDRRSRKPQENHPAYDFYWLRGSQPVNVKGRIVFRNLIPDTQYPVELDKSGKLYVNNAYVGEAAYHPATATAKASVTFYIPS